VNGKHGYREFARYRRRREDERFSDDERDYIAQVLSGLVKLVMSQLGKDFEAEAKADYESTPLWVQIKVRPYGEKEEESSWIK